MSMDYNTVLSAPELVFLSVCSRELTILLCCNVLLNITLTFLCTWTIWVSRPFNRASPGWCWSLHAFSLVADARCFPWQDARRKIWKKAYGEMVECRQTRRLLVWCLLCVLGKTTLLCTWCHPSVSFHVQGVFVPRCRQQQSPIQTQTDKGQCQLSFCLCSVTGLQSPCLWMSAVVWVWPWLRTAGISFSE